MHVTQLLCYPNDGSLVGTVKGKAWIGSDAVPTQTKAYLELLAERVHHNLPILHWLGNLKDGSRLLWQLFGRCSEHIRHAVTALTK